MHGYNDSNFDNKIKTDLQKGRFDSIVLARANDVFLDTKKKKKKKEGKKLLPNQKKKIKKYK